MELVEFKFRKGVRINLPEGVQPAKFDVNRVIASIPDEVLALFNNYGIDLKEECPGVFLKAFNLTALELKEVKENLNRLNELGLIGIFKSNPQNLQIRFFKNSFMKRLVECMQEGRPYLNPDNTFASFLIKNEMEQKVEEAPSNVIEVNFENASVNNVASQEPNFVAESNNVMEEGLALLPDEDKIRYRKFLYDMNVLIGRNPMDERLVAFVKNALDMVSESIARGEYKYITMEQIIESVRESMFEELPENDYIRDLVSRAFGEEIKGQGRAA